MKIYKKETIYDTKLTKENVLQIYASTIANLSISNLFTTCFFEINCPISPGKPGKNGFGLYGYAGTGKKDITERTMEYKGEPNYSRMLRNTLFGIYLRQVTLEDCNGKTKVTLEDSNNNAITKMQKTIDKILQ